MDWTIFCNMFYITICGFQTSLTTLLSLPVHWRHFFYEVEHSCHYKKKWTQLLLTLEFRWKCIEQSKVFCNAYCIFVLYLQVLTRKFMFYNVCQICVLEKNCKINDNCATVSPSYIHFSLVEYIKQSILLKIFYQQYPLTVWNKQTNKQTQKNNLQKHNFSYMHVRDLPFRASVV